MAHQILKDYISRGVDSGQTICQIWCKRRVSAGVETPVTPDGSDVLDGGEVVEGLG